MSSTTGTTGLESDPGPRVTDPELDAPRHRAPVRLDPDFRKYQRLVANPFLALTIFIFWCMGFRWAFFEKNLAILGLLLLGLPGIACALQFHCLDCNATDVLFRWKRHACEGAVMRQVARQTRRLRGPNPMTQTILWGYAIVIAAFLALTTWRLRG
jgi:hypothetical protein